MIDVTSSPVIPVLGPIPNRLMIASRLQAASIIASKRCGDLALSTGTNLINSTEKGIWVGVIQAARKKFGITQTRLAAEAGITEGWYRKIVAAPDLAAWPMLGRLTDAIRHIRTGQSIETVQQARIVHGMYRCLVRGLTGFFGVTVRQVDAADPRRAATANPHWLACAHCRQTALYLMHVQFGLSQREIARHTGLTEAAVCQAVHAVEERRDNLFLSRLLDDIAAELTGGLLP